MWFWPLPGYWIPLPTHPSSCSPLNASSLSQSFSWCGLHIGAQYSRCGLTRAEYAQCCNHTLWSLHLNLGCILTPRYLKVSTIPLRHCWSVSMHRWPPLIWYANGFTIQSKLPFLGPFIHPCKVFLHSRTTWTLRYFPVNNTVVSKESGMWGKIVTNVNQKQ